MNKYKVTAPVGTRIEKLIVHARSLDESFQEAVRVLESLGVRYRQIKGM